MYGWNSDNTKFASNKRTFNIRANTEIHPHALATGLTRGLLGGKVVTVQVHGVTLFLGCFALPNSCC